MKRLYIVTWYLILSILCLPFALSVSPFQSTAQDTGLTIISLHNEAYPARIPVKFHFHLHNSTGSIVKTNQVNYCGIHIYNKTMGHLIQANLTKDTNQLDMEYNYPSGFSEKGVYPFTVFCDGVKQDGFIADHFTVTEDGHIYAEHSVFLAVTIMIIGCISMLFWFSSLLKGDETWIQPIKLLINMICMFLTVAALGFGLQTLKYTTILSGPLYNTLVWMFIGMLFIVFPVFMLFFLRFIVEVLAFLKSLEKKEGGGWK